MNCRTLHEKKAIQCCGTACLLFATLAIRFGISDPELLAKELITWFSRPEGHISDAYRGPPHRERCEMGMRLLLWQQRLGHGE